MLSKENKIANKIYLKLNKNIFDSKFWIDSNISLNNSKSELLKLMKDKNGAAFIQNMSENALKPPFVEPKFKVVDDTDLMKYKEFYSKFMKGSTDDHQRPIYE